VTAVVAAPGRVLFAKNLTAMNEAQPRPAAASHSPTRRHAALHVGGDRSCADVRRAASRPFWMGAEIGANEHGVVIATRPCSQTPVAKTVPPAWTCCASRSNAPDGVGGGPVIIEMLETVGQGGGCGHGTALPLPSCSRCDLSGAFVFETAGNRWAVERVRGARAISNALTRAARARGRIACAPRGAARRRRACRAR
jgi:hypothetical protein